jgi:hypothetical protein
VGGIVAGAVVGSIAITAILVLGWYLVKVQKMRNTLVKPADMAETRRPQNASDEYDIRGAPSPMI